MPQSRSRDDSILELRQYQLHPAKRDTLIELFDDAFLEGQEIHGMAVVGQFRDLDKPDSFVWLRQFADMEARRTALTGFYAGDAWLDNRDAANATMISFDNVLLLKPAFSGGGFAFDTADRPVRGAELLPASVLTATICVTGKDATLAVVDAFRNRVQPVLERHGAFLLGCFTSETSKNTYPRLPIREGVHALVWFCRFDDATSLATIGQSLSNDPEWLQALAALTRLCNGKQPQTLRLAPTSRSVLGR